MSVQAVKKTKDSQFYLIWGWIAALSTAVYLIRDGGVKGEQITVFENLKEVWGSLDAKKLHKGKGFVMTGHRILAEHAFECTYEILKSIPSLKDAGRSVREEVDQFNMDVQTYAKARLIEEGQIADAHKLGLSWKQRYKIVAVLLGKEERLGKMRIDDYFDESFFETNFWLEFCTVFAFQPWHSLVEFRRYIYRSFQALTFYDTMECIRSTPHCQHDSIVVPMYEWLKKQGVVFQIQTAVTNLDFEMKAGQKRVKKIYLEHAGEKKEIELKKDDFAFVTLGSMTTKVSFGSMEAAPKPKKERDCVAWDLWENIAKADESFGKPQVFDAHVQESKWESFSITFQSKLFFDLMEKLTGNKEGTGGGSTFKGSNWLLSITIPHQPHFINQGKDEWVCWGYALRIDEKGNYINKPMPECSGEEILEEVICHLGFEEYKEEIMQSANCIPCLLPYITSQFEPREKGDRPDVVPVGAENFAFLGQFCEIPRDIVFTVEYSIRSAQIAVYNLLGIKKKVEPIYQGHLHPGNVWRGIRTLLR